MVLLLFLVLLTLTLLFFLHVRKQGENEGRCLPPGPTGLPFVGNLHHMNNPAPHVHLWQLSKQHGPIMSLRLGLVPAVVVSSAGVAKEVFKTHDLEFAGRPSMLGQQKLSYNGLDVAFTPYSRYWREMRKICVVHLLSSKRVQSFRSIREDEVSRMIQTFSKSAAAAEPTNFSKAVMLLSTNIISRIAFGKRFEDEEYENSRFHALLSEAEAMLFGFFFTDYLPFMGWVDRLTGLMARLEKNFKELDLFYEEIIKDHLDQNRPWKDKEDITDILLRVKRENLASMDLTKDHIKAVLMVVVYFPI